MSVRKRESYFETRETRAKFALSVQINRDIATYSFISQTRNFQIHLVTWTMERISRMLRKGEFKHNVAQMCEAHMAQKFLSVTFVPNRDNINLDRVANRSQISKL